MPVQSDNTDTNPGPEGAKSSKPKHSELLETARKRYKLCQDADANTGNRLAAVDDLKFLSGGDNQWEAKGLAARKHDGRPVITVNVLPAFLHQVTNDQRQNTPSIKVHPVGDKADIETAKVRQGMIRHIEYISNADVAYDTAVNSAAAIGFGYFRVMPEYVSPESFEQKLCFKRVRNALSVRTDPLSVEADGSDSKFCFIESLVPKDEFKREHPDANASNPTFFSSDAQTYSGWYSDSTVTVCEYYYFEETDDEVVRLSNGETGLKSKLLEMPEGVKIEESRKTRSRKLMWCKITGADVLEETEIKCKWIPVFPVYGDELDIEGRVIRSGLVRNSKGPCQSYNVMMSGATEEIAMRSKAPYIGAEGQFEGHEAEWDQANNRAWPYLEYKMKELNGKLAPSPQRQPMTDIPAGMLAMTMHAADNIKRTTGMFDASLGARGTATSGKQELAQQREGDVANFHYMDGLLRAIRFAGRCINCMIPHYYDTQRTVAVMREDDQTDYATINEQLPTPRTDPKTGAIQSVLNDMTCGEFDVTVSAGPNYTTMRQESSEFFTSAMQAAKDPATIAITTWAAMRNQDAPGADLAAKMMGAMLPPPAQAVLKEEEGDEEEQVAMVQTPQGPVPADQAGNMIAQLMQGLQQAEEALQKADASKQQAEALKQQHLLGEQQLEPQRQAVEMARIDAEKEKAIAAQKQADAAHVKAQAELEQARADAVCAPAKAEAELRKCAIDEMTAEIKLLTTQQQVEVDAAVAEATALNGDGTAFEAWKASLEANTKIKVAEIMARSREKAAASKPAEKRSVQ